MSEDEEVQRLLLDAGRPRRPSTKFEHRLRSELFDDTTVGTDGVEGATSDGVPGRRLPALAVAAAVLAVLVAAVVWGSAAPRQDVVADGNRPVPTSGPDARVSDACAVFRSTAFAPMDREAVLGPANTAALSDAATTAAAVERLAASVDRLLEATTRAGLDQVAGSADAERLVGQLREARGATADPAQLARVHARLRTAGDHLNALARRYNDAGVAGCL